jgi:hypothetical protein
MKEAKARIKINKLLEEAGWRFLDAQPPLTPARRPGKVNFCVIVRC